MRFSILVIITLTFTNPFDMLGQNKLIYVGDPMCSWCYGFAPELEQLVQRFDGKIDLELVTGGLRPYFEKPINEMKDFLSEHWSDVNRATGQAFNFDILDHKTLKYDTEPACRAVVVVRSIDPAKGFEFFKMIQEAFYYHNKDLRQVESYDSILETLNLDVSLFKQRFNSEEYKTLAKQDFTRAADLGVRGFPTVLLQVNGQVKVLSRGYTSAQSLSDNIKRELNL